MFAKADEEQQRRMFHVYVCKSKDVSSLPKHIANGEYTVDALIVFI